MRVIRLYTQQHLALNIELELDDAVRHHAINVLRINKHSLLKLFNGDGFDYACEIIHCSKTCLRIKVTEQLRLFSESPLMTHLYLGISKSAHMDYAIQKTVEAGVSHIQPILMHRSASKITAKSLENKHKHWLRIIQCACEQCGRAIIPRLLKTCELHENEALDKQDIGLLLDTGVKQTMKNLNIKNPKSIKLLIGPEGGLDENEIKYAMRKGFRAVRCGPRILRTETAALTAVLLAQILWGDLAG